MSFWTTEALKSTGTIETDGGDMAPIPARTQVKVAIDEAKWDDYQGDDFISLRWTVLAPAEFKNRKIFQKLWVNGNNPQNKNPKEQGEKAIKMLGAIAVNAGGGLLKTPGKPTDADLQKHLLNKPMAIMLQVWRIEKDQDGNPVPKDEQKAGNWVSSVSPLKAKAPAAAVAEPVAAAATAEPEPSFDDDGDEPF